MREIDTLESVDKRRWFAARPSFTVAPQESIKAWW